MKGQCQVVDFRLKVRVRDGVEKTSKDLVGSLTSTLFQNPIVVDVQEEHWDRISSPIRDACQKC